MTTKQELKLKSIENVLNSFENTFGALVIDARFGTSYFIRLFIGKNGGFRSDSIIYKHYDFTDNAPYYKLFTYSN